MLKMGDPFVAKMYDRYLKFKRRGKGPSDKKNFYERMK